MKVERVPQYRLQKYGTIHALCVFNCDTWQYDVVLKGKLFFDKTFLHKNGTHWQIFGLQNKENNSVSQNYLQKQDDNCVICVFNSENLIQTTSFKTIDTVCKAHTSFIDQTILHFSFESGTERRFFWLTIREKVELRLLNYVCNADEKVHLVSSNGGKKDSFLKKKNDIYTLVYYDSEANNISEFVLEEKYRIKQVSKKHFYYFDGTKLILFSSTYNGISVLIYKCEKYQIEESFDKGAYVLIEKAAVQESFFVYAVWEKDLQYFPAK